MLISNLDYLESASDLTIEGGAVKTVKLVTIAVPVSLNQAFANSVAEGFGQFTFSSAISGTSTTIGSSFSSASSISVSSNKPIAVLPA